MDCFLNFITRYTYNLDYLEPGNSIRVLLLSEYVNLEALEVGCFGNVYSLIRYGAVLWGGGSAERGAFIIQKWISETMLVMGSL